MHQLGLHELAEAVLGRARRRAGNKAAALVGLMLQYQRQDKIDVAVQVALQILRSHDRPRHDQPQRLQPRRPRRRPRGGHPGPGPLRPARGSSSSGPRSSSRRTPNAVQLHQALADYYKAAGQRDKARAELIKVAELRPDDATLRFQVANQLVQEGQAAAAVEHYKAALKKDPSRLGRDPSTRSRTPSSRPTRPTSCSRSSSRPTSARSASRTTS